MCVLLVSHHAADEESTFGKLSRVNFRLISAPEASIISIGSAHGVSDTDSPLSERHDSLVILALTPQADVCRLGDLLPMSDTLPRNIPFPRFISTSTGTPLMRNLPLRALNRRETGIRVTKPKQR